MAKSVAAKMASLAIAALAAATPVGSAPATAADQFVVWAWERPEDLRFLPPDVEIAALSGFVELRGEDLFTRGRRFPLKARPGQVQTSVVHVQISRTTPLRWTLALRARTSAAVLTLFQHIPARRLQIDFEVKRSERQALLDLMADVKRALPPGVALSMTAIAAWCQTEDWISSIDADEVAPMLFRMGAKGAAIRERLAQGEDFTQNSCRQALAISVDAPLMRAPTGRRIYLFNPRSWTARDFEQARGEIEGWRAINGVGRWP